MVRLTAGTLTLDGAIVSDGTAPEVLPGFPPPIQEGPGSGGGIYVSVTTLEGTGSIQAAGANGTYVGGGGGRVAVYASDWSQFNLNNIQAVGGTAGNNNPPGGAGTVYLDQIGAPQGTLIVDAYNGGTGSTPLGLPGETIQSFPDLVVIQGKGTLATSSVPLDFQQGLTVQNSASLEDSGTLTVAATLTWTGGNISDPGGLIISPGSEMIFDGPTQPFNGALTDNGVLEVQSGTLQLPQGNLEIDGSGMVITAPSTAITIAGNLVGQTQDAQLFDPQGLVELNGSGTAAAPQLLEVMGADVGAVAAGFNDNFAYGTLALSNNTYVQLVDNANNSSSLGPEALYVNSLIVPSGSTLNLNGLHAYARAAQINGMVAGGAVSVLPSGGGPLQFNQRTPANLAVAGTEDDWTFFGQVGQTLAIAVNTGNQSSVAPLQPSLNYAEVSLIDPNGNIIAESSNTQTGTDVVLQGITLQTTGTFHIHIQAATGHAGNTGYYLVTAWNTDNEMNALEVNQTITSQIETPYSIDTWTFAALANEQVSFVLLNTSGAGVQFDLTGPGGRKSLAA